MNVETPFFLIDKLKLDKNIKEFKIALQKHWPNSIFSYSVKTNSLPWVLETMHAQNIMAEVVSDEEYQLCQLLGFTDNEIVYNGPIKGNKQLQSALDGNAIINIDSERELDFILNNRDSLSERIGIRVNVPTEIFNEADIGYQEDGFRFGFSEDTGRLEEVVLALKKSGLKRFGLHFHVNSVSRSIDVYKEISKYAKKIIKKYELSPSFIDIGGGFFGGLPGKPSADIYIKSIKEELLEVIDIDDTKLIIEPGSAIIGSCVELHSTVLDTKETKNVDVITTDASRLHIDPLWKKSAYFYRVENKSKVNSNSFKEKLICGYTCMDHDRIMKIEGNTSLNVDDKIIYENVGAYSMTLGGPFIKYYPKVLVKQDKEYILVRDEMTVDDYFKVHKAVEYRRLENE